MKAQSPCGSTLLFPSRLMVGQMILDHPIGVRIPGGEPISERFRQMVHVPNVIVSYLHCRICFNELPDGQSMAEFARLNIGQTMEGAIQVWCTRHEVNVGIIGSTDEAVPACEPCEHSGH